METATQLALPLFDEPSFEELLKQRSLLELVSVTLHPRLRRGWQVKMDPRSGRRLLLVPAVLADAPAAVKNALIEWALLPWRQKRRHEKALLVNKKELERVIWRHLDSRTGMPTRTTRFDPERIAGKTHGRRHDLREVFDSVNKTHFGGTLSSLLRWGPSLSKTSHHMIKTDRAGNTLNLITIAGVYNHAAVPQFAIEAVMYHEMLHIAIPPWKKKGRRVVHGAAFKKAEQSFPGYQQWRTWERTVLPGLLGRKRFRFE